MSCSNCGSSFSNVYTQPMGDMQTPLAQRAMTQPYPMAQPGTLPSGALPFPAFPTGISTAPVGVPISAGIPSLPVGMPSGPAMGSIPGTQAASAPTGAGFVPGAPQTVQNTDFMPGYLRTQIGRNVRVEFLIGTGGPLIDRTGTLIGVGTSYILLRPEASDDILMCDLYSIKFVTFLF